MSALARLSTAAGGVIVLLAGSAMIASAHTASCAKKESCAKSGYAIISGKTMYKLDKESAEKATAYLKDSNATKVTVEGTKDGDMLKVTSIKAAE